MRPRPSTCPKPIVFIYAAVLACCAACNRPDRTVAAVPIDAASADAAPDEDAARRSFEEWLAAFNTGDRSVLLEYHARVFPYDAGSADVLDVDRELGLSQGTGGFVVHRIEEATATRAVALLKERRSDQCARVTMEVDPYPPHRVARFEIHPVDTPDDLLPPDERNARRFDGVRRSALIEGVARNVDAHYVFPDAGSRMAKTLRERAARGDYDGIDDAKELARTLTTQLRELSHDLHLWVEFARKRPPPPEQPREDRLAHHRAQNFGFGKIERLDGNVAVIDVRGFAPLDDDVRDAVAGFMSQVADADALLLDLRANHGGDPGTVALVASYLFDATPVHLTDFFIRDRRATEQSWTLRSVNGARFGAKKPIYVLTSKETISGGEELAYDLQSLRRAQTVGETTAGAANPAGPYDIDDWFRVIVPGGRPINPITKKNWEGVGVVPDVPVPAGDALAEAHRRAMRDVAASRSRPKK